MSSHRKPHGLPASIGGTSVTAWMKLVGVAVGLFALLVAAAGLAQTASAFPNKAKDCTGCHGSGTVAGTVTATPSTTAPAAGASYTVAIAISVNPNGGDTGYWIANSNAAGVTGTGVVFGGQTGSGSPNYTVPMTAPAVAGTYWYKVWGVQGLNDASAQTNFGLYSVTVGSVPSVPVLSTVSPTHALPGATVTISGTNLGTAGAVKFGTAAAATTAWTATSITATVPATLAAGALSITVTPTGLATSNALAFTVDSVVVPPTTGQAFITALSPTRGVVGSKVTITGTDFGAKGFVTFGKEKAKVLSWTATKIVVRVPEGHKGKVLAVTVTPKAAHASNSVSFLVLRGGHEDRHGHGDDEGDDDSSSSTHRS